MTHIPYGYRMEAAEAVIYEPEADKLRAFFEEYKICKSMRAAAMKVGIDKTHSFLGKLLKNRTYLGTDFYPSLIEQSLFDEVQEIRDQNAKAQNRIRNFKPQATADCSTVFEAVPVEERYEDLYQQAEYAYSQIGVKQ